MYDPLSINLCRQRRLLAASVSISIPELSSVPEFLDYLSTLLASPPYTLLVASLFRPLLFELSARFLQSSLPTEDQFVSICLLLETYQELYPILHELLKRHPLQKGPLNFILGHQSISQSRLHRLLLAYYRILQANRQLPTLIHWSPYPLCRVIWNNQCDNASRLLAIRCYSLQMLLPEAEREQLETQVFGQLYAPDCPLEFEYLLDGSIKSVDGWLLPVLEQQRIEAERTKIAQDPVEFYQEDDDMLVPKILDEHLSPYTANIHGIFMLREAIPIPATPLIPTTSTVKSLQSIAIHLSCDLPLLLTSPPSSGKSLLISHLATILHPSSHNHVITIHLADTSLEPRSLLGSYVSSSTRSGTFEWKEGVLVKSMREGKWVVFKDIDRASSEVLGVIKPLVASLNLGKWIGGRAELDVPNKGRIVAAYGFAIFATRSVTPQRNGSYPPPNFLGCPKFHEVSIDPPTSEDLHQIVEVKFPRLKGAPAMGLINLWEATKIVITSSSREIGIRDLEKICTRVVHLLPSTSPIHQDVSMDDLPLISSFPNIALREAIYLEARDVFFGFGSTNNATKARLDSLATLVAQHLGFEVDRQQFLLSGRVPDFRVEKDVNGNNIAVVAGFTRLPALMATKRLSISPTPSRPFAMHRPATVLISRIASAVFQSEPILLTGETGTGKTTIITHLATLLNRTLVSLNLSQQTETSDLLGGFKPVDARVPGGELQVEFVDLFGNTFSRKKNEKFEGEVRKAVTESKWKRAVKLWKESVRLAKERIQKREQENTNDDDGQDAPRKRRKTGQETSNVTEGMWTQFENKVAQFEIQHVHGKSKFAFDFVEGSLVRALRAGHWVLLDEINLATSETLECISSLLQGPTASITLTEQGSLEPVPRHDDFRLFACMNPATDVGKKDLPPNIRSRFTEIDVPPPDADRDTLLSIISQYIGAHATGDKSIILDIADFYIAVKQLSTERAIADGANHRPHYSMRTLTRALTFTSDTAHMFGLRRALWEGCLMLFTMVLDGKSAIVVTALARRYLFAGVKNPESLLAKSPPAPPSPGNYLKFSPFYLEKGHRPLEPVDNYVLTPSVRKKLTDLGRIILTRRFPVLIEGPTSAGKTSAVEYLAKRTGHRFVRINNHEHTDIQEYIGSYVSDPATGKLLFKDGLLVRALRNGDWIVLDELNLAPTDVLEALNRLLDDNRELVIPETHEVVRPHPHFMLFATQNPPGAYAGRKVLSRAFRNRFLEVHFDDVPQDELKEILHLRCRIAPSYAEKIVRVFAELQKRRQSSRVFESRYGFATLRDLFRWAGRDAVGYQQLAENGFMLLAERARQHDDKLAVKDVIESVMVVRLDVDNLYNFQTLPQKAEDFLGCSIPHTPTFIWTKAMQRLFVLLSRALRYNEPVLLVGETGSGKTSICQVYTDACHQALRSLNCHQNTETADILGGLRPIRNRSALSHSILNDSLPTLQRLGVVELPNNISELSQKVKQLLKDPHLPATTRHELDTISHRIVSSQALFQWQDGPLLQSMKEGEIFLLDEISLADDSVLERLNSVLEPSRTIVLAEKGGDDEESLTVEAQHLFKLVATMNPGGDYGKKELSPALRNRFTEIWVPPIDDRNDLALILDSLWCHKDLQCLTSPVLDFVDWLRGAIGDSSIASLRDLLTFIHFSNTAKNSNVISVPEIFHHAAQMTFLDGLSTLPQVSSYSNRQIKLLLSQAFARIQELVPFTSSSEVVPSYDTSKCIQLGSFALPLGPEPPKPQAFSLHAPTAQQNAMRVVRAFQVPKPILLEGSPGVGKTSLVTALASISGHELCRINLSDQTDLSDLFGSDLPAEGSGPGEFAWRDGEFLRAIQEGKWVLLDEMNLASQSVLEGLNAILDHRGTVYIPELGHTFTKHSDFRLFAAQNPLSQGGGRKGLPKSFLNRFTRVYVDELAAEDMLIVCRHIFPSLDSELLRRMIAFNNALQHEVSTLRAFATFGSPWEFNLRDVMRWCTLLHQSPGHHPSDFLWNIYLCRFRTEDDRLAAKVLFQRFFELDLSFLSHNPKLSIRSSDIRIGHVQLPVDSFITSSRTPPFSTAQHFPLEALANCIRDAGPSILCGPSNSGKTSLIRALADRCGKKLQELHITGATDTLDILGGFEQTDNETDLYASLQVLFDKLQTQLRHHACVSFSEAQWSAIHQLQVAATCNAHPKSFVEALRIISPLFPEQAAKVLDSILTLKKLSSPQFAWIDGPLTEALKQGNWLLLDSANLCSASVLDRLNALCEPGGALTLNERGFVDGGIPVIRPHPNFRLFLTMDPRFGELSRAMRNRSTEVFLDHFNDERTLFPFHRLLPGMTTLSFSDTARVCRSLLPFSRTQSESNSLVWLPQDCRLASVTQQLSLLSVEGDLHATFSFLFEAVALEFLPLYLRYSQTINLLDLSSFLESLAGLGKYIQEIHAEVGIDSSSSDYLISQATDVSLINVLRTCGRLFPIFETLHQRTFWLGKVLASFFLVQRSPISLPANVYGFNKLRRRIYDELVAMFKAIPTTYQFLLSKDLNLRPISECFFFLHEIQIILSSDVIDYSALRVILARLKNLDGLTMPLIPLSLHIETLFEILTLRQGTGLFEIWVAFSKLYPKAPFMVSPTPPTQHLSFGISHILPPSCLTDSLDLRNKTLDLLAIRRLSSNDASGTSSLGELKISTTTWSSWMISVFSVLVSVFQNADTLPPKTISRLIGIGCKHSVLPLNSMVLLRQLDWALDARQDLHIFTPRLFIEWLQNLWLLPDSGGLSMLLRPSQLLACIAACSPSEYTLASLPQYEKELQFQAHISVFHPQTNNGSQEKLLTMLNFSLEWVLTWFGHSISVSYPGSPQLQFCKLLEELERFSSPSVPTTIRTTLLSVLSELKDNCATTFSLSHSFIALSRTILELYVPDPPIDPAACEAYHAAFLGRLKLSLDSHISLHKQLELSTSGGDVNDTVEMLHSEQVECVHQISQHEAPIVQRDVLMVQSFWAELSQFRHQVISDSRVDSLVRLLANLEPGSAQREAVMQDSIDGFLQRLGSAYPDFSDLACPIHVALHYLKIGLRLGSCSSQQQSGQIQHDAVRMTVMSPLIRATEMVTESLSIPPSGSSFDLLLVHLAASAVERCIGRDASISPLVQELYSKAFRVWNNEATKAGHAEQEAQSLYRRTNVQHESRDDLVLEEEELRSLFPLYENVLDSEDASRVDTMVKPSHYSHLVDIHKCLTSPQPSSFLPKAHVLFNISRQQILTSYVENSQSILAADLDHCSLPYRVNSFSAALKNLQTSNLSKPNFYLGHNISEVRKATTLVLALRDRLVVLLQEWSDQLVLHHLLSVCDGVLSLKITSPVAKVLAALEQLLGKTDDWETFSNRENSLKQHRQALTEQIVDWRRLELSCWRVLLDDQERDFSRETDEWWFRLYELVIHGATDASQRVTMESDSFSTYLDNLVPLLHEFVHTAPLGQFEARLSLLRSFHAYSLDMALTHPPLSRIAQILSAMHSQFSLFSTAVATTLRNQREPLEREITDFIKLASWKDVNVHALQQSAKRTHHQLYKIIRKFREVLRQPVSPLFSAPRARAQDSPDSHSVTPTVDLVTPLITPLPIDDNPTSLSPLRHFGQTFNKFVKLVVGPIAMTMDHHVGKEPDQFATEVISTADMLAKVPIQKGVSAEKRAKNAKSVLQRKRKALSDLLKELKRVGLPINISPEQMSSQRNARWLGEHLCLDSISKPDPGSYVLRLHSLLPELREALSNHHSDVSTRDLQRTTFFIEAILSFGIVSRKRFLHVSQEFLRLTGLHKRLTSLKENLEQGFVEPGLVGRVEKAIRGLQGLAYSLREVQDGLLSLDSVSQGNHTRGSLDSQISELITSTDALGQVLSNILEQVTITETPIIFKGEFDTLQKAEQHLQAAYSDIQEWAKNLSSVAFLITPVADWLGAHVQNLGIPKREERTFPTGEPLINTYLVSVQQLLAICPEDPELQGSPDQDGYLRTTQKTLIRISSAFNIDHVRNHLETLLIAICISSRSEEEKQVVLDRVLPFSQVYLAILEQHVDAYSSWTRGLFKLGYILSSIVLSLSKEGFCQPPDSEENENDEGGTDKAELAEGMGLGAGSGAKNVSNEIEDEAQVEGIRGEEEEEEDQREEGDDDNAIEMDDDVGGKLEDVPEEESQGDKSDDEEEEDNPDERREDLDPSDPSAVDEKLWGDDSVPEDDSKQPDQTTSEDRSKEQSSGESEVVAKEGPKQDGSDEVKEKGEEKDKEEGDEMGEDLPDETAPNEAGAPMDEHIPDANALELPEDMNLDSEENGAEGEAEDDDIEMGEEDLGEQGEEDGGEDDTTEGRDEPIEEDQPEGTVPNDADMPQATEDVADDQEGEQEEPDASTIAQRDVAAGQGDSDDFNQGTEQQGQGSTGSSGVAMSGDNSKQEDTGEQDQQNSETERPSQTQPLASTDHSQPSQQKDAGAAAGNESGEMDHEQPASEKPPNPLRSLGEALKEIQQRFDDILESEIAKEQVGDVQNQLSQLEYLRPEEQDYDMEALGPADNDPQAKLEELNIVNAEDTVEENQGDIGMDMQPDPPKDNLLPHQELPPLPQDGQNDNSDSRPQDGAVFGERGNLLDMDHSAGVDEEDQQPSHSLDDGSLEIEMKEWQSSDHDLEATEKLWSLYSSQTHDLAYSLCEQLRLILEPTRATRLKGDYRTGKRLNMKKVISYIASDYTKDKIWLRRTRPSQREYQVLIALDDSRSMAESRSVHLSYQTLALVTKALDRLESGDVAIAKFGEKFDMLHTFDDGQFTDQAGAKVIEAFRFDQKATNVLKLVEQSLTALEGAREKRAMSSSSAGDLWQLEVIISDGMCQDHEKLRPVLRKAEEQKVMIVFIIIDALHQGAGATVAPENSIVYMEKAGFLNVGGKMELQLGRYLDSFPFEYYVVVRNMEALPEVLAGTLKQFFERISED